MPKSSQFSSKNAQKQGGGGFLSELPKGECIQVWNNRMTKTEGDFFTWGSSTSTPPDEPSIYHRPWYGNVSRKQPDGSKE